MWAAREGDLKTIEVLLEAGANLHQKDKHGKTAFLLAAEGGKPEAIKKFLSLGFEATAADEYGGWTALIYAARYPEAVKVLIDAGAKVNAASKVLSMTPLFVAAQNGWAESVKVLIDAGADVNLANSDGITPLNRAIVGKHSEVIELLRKAGAKE
jgi:ankyrin repeat protein